MLEFQNKVGDWCIDCLGQSVANDHIERNWRFLEEALELVQSLGGNAEDAHKMVEYVFNREVGEPKQEVGGVMVTLAALCQARGLPLQECANTELQRISEPTNKQKIREKQARRPLKSPLPGRGE